MHREPNRILAWLVAGKVRKELTASPHSFSKRFSVRSCTTGKRLQHAGLIAVLTPSGHVARLVLNPVCLTVREDFKKLAWRVGSRLTVSEKRKCKYKSGKRVSESHLLRKYKGVEEEETIRLDFISRKPASSYTFSCETSNPFFVQIASQRCDSH